MTDEQAAAAGSRAASELEQTSAAFAKVRQAMIDELISTGPGMEAKRERLIVGCQIIDAVKAALMAVVNNGQYSREMISAREALAEQDLLRR